VRGKVALPGYFTTCVKFASIVLSQDHTSFCYSLTFITLSVRTKTGIKSNSNEIYTNPCHLLFALSSTPLLSTALSTLSLNFRLPSTSFSFSPSPSLTRYEARSRHFAWIVGGNRVKGPGIDPREGWDRWKNGTRTGDNDASV